FLVVDDHDPASRDARCSRPRLDLAARRRLGPRQPHGDRRALAKRGFEADRVIEKRGQPLDDRKSQPQALQAASARLHLIELLEDAVPMLSRDTDSGVCHDDIDALGSTAGAEQYATLLGIAN